MLFNETATTAIYPDFHTLSLRDALPLCSICRRRGLRAMPWSSLRWFSPRLPGLQVSLSRGPPDEHAHADRPDPWPGLCQGRDSSLVGAAGDGRCVDPADPVVRRDADYAGGPRSCARDRLACFAYSGDRKSVVGG